MNDSSTAKKADTPIRGITAEVGLMLRRTGEVWHIVPRKHKWALGGAAIVMAVTSVCNTALPLFLGLLVDGVQRTAAVFPRTKAITKMVRKQK